MRITPLEAPFGAQAHGVDLTRTPSDRLIRTLAHALYANRILVLKDQAIDKSQYRRFAAQWGTLIVHVLDYLRVPGFPEMMAIGNTEKKDREPEVRNGAVHWHTDGSYKVEPTMVTMLYAQRAPERGGETLFCDMVAAYEALDEDQQRVAESSIAWHFFGAAKTSPGENPVTPITTQDQADAVPPVKKPLVMEHPITGHRALYGLGQSPYAIDGLDQNDADARLLHFKTHATQPRFVYKHRYEVGDIVLIDCLSTMHMATSTEVAASPDARNARLLWRLSTEGLPPAIEAEQQQRMSLA